LSWPSVVSQVTGRLTRHEAHLPTFPDKPALQRRWICSLTGKLAGPSCPGIHAPFLQGTEPKAACAEAHLAPAGETPKAKYEGLWQRLAREKEEREAAEREP
jgi:hypothetical protein